MSNQKLIKVIILLILVIQLILGLYHATGLIHINLFIVFIPTFIVDIIIIFLILKGEDK